MFPKSRGNQAAARVPEETDVGKTARIACVALLVAEECPHLDSETLSEVGWKQTQERTKKTVF
jgi:hypothetical protein